MVNKIMYQKIQHFKRRGFTKADIVREIGLNKRTVFKIRIHKVFYIYSEKIWGKNV